MYRNNNDILNCDMASLVDVKDSFRFGLSIGEWFHLIFQDIGLLKEQERMKVASDDQLMSAFSNHFV